MDDLELNHIAGRVFGAPLLIQPEKLHAILGFMMPRFEGKAAAPAPKEKAARKITRMEGDAAVIPIQGPLVNKSSWLEAACGMTSYETISHNFDAALSDPSVKRIVLDFDSPGGEANGVFELADKIFAARGQKPIVAVVDSMAASAAYALASAADKVVVSRLGAAGSIGVITAHIDQSARDANAGLKYTVIHAGEHKNDGNPHFPLTEGARSEIQSHVDQIYGVFVSTVARNRGISEQIVRDTEARVYLGEEAVKMRLADEIGGLQGGALVSRTSLISTTPQEKTMSTENEPENDAPAPTPEVTQEPEPQPEESESPAQAIANAVMAERLRVKEIVKSATALNVPETVFMALIEDGTSLVKAQKTIIDYAADSQPSSGIRAAANTEAGFIDPDLPLEERCKQEWDANPALRKEFGDKYERFLAFSRAEERARV